MCSDKVIVFLLLCFFVEVEVHGRNVKGSQQILKKEKNSWRIYLEDSGRRILITTEVKEKMKNCYLSGDEYIIQLALQTVSKSRVSKVAKTEMTELVELCTYAKWSGFLGAEEVDIYNKLGIASSMVIYPGTKWCGAGNVSDGYDDLGPERETDACCREHDHCPDSIEGFGSGHGLDNNSPFTKSNCKCDEIFYSCLKKVNTGSSNRVGKIYYNYIRMECFRFTHPIVQCEKYKGRSLDKAGQNSILERIALVTAAIMSDEKLVSSGGQNVLQTVQPTKSFADSYIRPRCVKYELDETQTPIWQWFDAREYRPTGEDRTALQATHRGDVPEYALNSEPLESRNLTDVKNWLQNSIEFIPLEHAKSRHLKARESPERFESQVKNRTIMDIKYLRNRRSPLVLLLLNKL